jgi:acetyl esterase/lipase
VFARRLMTLLLKPWRLVLLGIVVGLLVTGLVYGSWIAAQARAVVVLSTTIETPVLTWAVKVLTDEPRVSEIRLGGAPTTLARPGGGDGPWPAVLFVNGATPLGRREPDVQDLARGLARAGYVVLIPDLPGLAEGELGDRTLAATIAAARAATRRHDVDQGRIGLVGVSVGATLALLAAESPAVAGDVSLVAGIAPYTDLREVVRLATTGYHRVGRSLLAFETEPFLDLVVARSLAGSLPADEERRRLLATLDGADEGDPNPLAAFAAAAPGNLSPEAEAVVRVLANRDPRRFDRLYATLPAPVRTAVARLSPITRAAQLEARVELASAPMDKYFPVEQSRALVLAAPNARLTVTEAFAHVVPRPSLSDPGDVFRFNAWAVRSLRALRG